MSRGVVIGLAAYVLWGLSPIFWKQLDGVPAGDIVAYRVLATAVVLLGVHLVFGTLRRAAAAVEYPMVPV